ncbi:hypothetical protein SAMN04487785_10128 [Dyella jiangningensis]|uniref:hypothetical protein n=1 Tax=Dyella sp. AtDHG13 TaxID=1938897 RepID=UPI000889C929|nr:hypothetical protein [Dyella sp. AtDHG13]PXV59529.1 hypothetical protein BDW41_10359 [Dyella sp. AtDHG13]SDJ14521.1 hypothetical protein SAMN04487785_10128 [Dyella jiangningensis]
MKQRLSLAASTLATLLALAGCSQSGDQAQAPQQAEAPADDSADKLNTYRQLQRIGNDEMAVTMGKEILSRYPNSDAAKEVQQSLPAIEQRYKENSEKNRLAGLWLYQVSPMAGGTQSTATIYTSQPAGEERVRLVLRRHTEWGQNAFLFNGGPHGFVCKGVCSIKATFDGKPGTIAAFAPTTGEPALLFKDDKGFIAQLEKAKKITMDVTLQDGEKKQTLLFETGGFDPSKWQAVSKSPAKKK